MLTKDEARTLAEEARRIGLKGVKVEHTAPRGYRLRVTNTTGQRYRYFQEPQRAAQFLRDTSGLGSADNRVLAKVRG